MQVTETKSEGLKRMYSLVVAAADLTARTAERLESLRRDVQIKGFRKGKAPLALLRKQFGTSILGEVVKKTVEDSVTEHLAERGHRPANQPRITITNEEFDEGHDLHIEIAYECLPEIPELDYSTISLERRTVEVDDDLVAKSIERMADLATDYQPREDGEEAESADQVVIDFVGRIDGETFDGGEAEDYPLVLGLGRLLPSFEEQLEGTKAGDDKKVAVTFPEEYPTEHLAGKDAIFEVKVKEVRKPVPAPIDDDLAKRFGSETIDELKEVVCQGLVQQLSGVGRALIKRRLLDALNGMVSFELPESMVDTEANSIAHQLWQEENPDAPSDDRPKIVPTEEHVSLAARRVRLGLLLTDVGRRESVEVTGEELYKAVTEEARQYPGREKEFIQFVSQSREEMARMHAPLFEDKVVDAILAKANVTETAIAMADLEAEFAALDPEDDPGSALADHDGGDLPWIATVPSEGGEPRPDPNG